MKTSPLLAVVLMCIVAAPAAAQPVDPTVEPVAEHMTAEPEELRAGDAVTVTGEGCAPGNRIRFELLNPDLATTAESQAAADGTFVQTLVLPSATKPGRTWLRAICLTPEGTERLMEAVILVRRPEFLITWTNVLFGLGTALLTAGLGIALLSSPNRRRRSSTGRISSKTRKRRRRKRNSRGRPDPGQVDVSVANPSGPDLNGTKEVDPRTIEVD